MTAHAIEHGATATRRDAPKAAPVRQAAMVVLALATLAVWEPVFGARTFWFVPTLAAGIAIVTGAIPARSAVRPWIVTGFWLLWTPVVLALTLHPISLALPHSLGEGARSLVEDGRSATDPSSFAAWLTFAGGVWLVGCDLTARPRRSTAATAFFLLALPFAVAIPMLSHQGGAAWQGGVVLAAALLWATRGTVRGSVPAVVCVALLATLLGLAIGPKKQWNSLGEAQHRASSGLFGGGSGSGGAPRSTNGGEGINHSMTYGPVSDDFSGQTMLRITAAKPALWRMQTYDVFNGSGWVVGSTADDDLPQPSVVGTKIGVQVEGLHDNEVVSPGRVLGVSGAGVTGRGPGEAVTMEDPPPSGSTYSVTAQTIDVPFAKLASLQIPTGDQYTKYTTVFPGSEDIPTPATSVAGRLTPGFAASETGQTLLIAKQLSNAPTELGVVQNVERYLGSSTFHYSLDAPAAGTNPIVDFITKTHVGYCQHFAGAAALLLRLAGVPTRVAAGFSTGTSNGGGIYDVRDEDAHAWIEVYFAGVGWVPFNPTPPSAAAAVGAGVDVLSPKASGNTAAITAPHAGPGKLAAIALIAAAAASLLLLWWRSRRGVAVPPLGDVLLRLVPPPADASTTHLEIRAAMIRLGPSMEALAVQAERERFGPPGSAPEGHPFRRVRRALLRDVGPWRALWLMAVGPPRPLLTDGVAPGTYRAAGDDPDERPLAGVGVAPASAAVEPTNSVAPPR